ncbi:MAG: P1 family peptidase [Actinobacteria bacterium]|nr:P1 family peptidase [Actinomycetota bacterium]
MSLGHWTGRGTGVSVVLCPEGTVGSCEVRGGAPATRETALLEPTRSVERVDAVVLTGGSAFGLATADGVMAWLAEQGRGFPTRGGPVPIVPTAAIYDLAEDVDRPGPDEGRVAVEAAAKKSDTSSGRIGAGTGATIGKWRGADDKVPGGLGIATHSGSLNVDAIAVVNAVGDVVADDGAVIAGSSAPADAPPFPEPRPFEATTLVVVATDAPLSKLECQLLAQSGHDGLARSLRPAHTRHDGDLVLALATGTGTPRDEAEPFALDRLRVVVTEVVAEAVRNAVRQT